MVDGHEHKPSLSVVVVVYNMLREARRTLHSLSAAYQRHIHADDYEVIVVDNGSNPPFGQPIIDGLAGNFRLIRIDPAPCSPAHAINRGLAEAQGDVIGVMIDGARIVTPGLLHFARHGARLYDKAVVATLGWYLGYDFQKWSMQYGYNHAREDALIDSIDWPKDGYRLFEIGTLDE
jgi:glycosyltransferase involved in cell wall biosynthesis